MKIVGVMHAYNDPSGFPIELSPSSELEELIANLEKGSRVGIELLPPSSLVDAEVAASLEAGTVQLGGEYFKKVEALAKENDLNIVYLEDPELEVKKLQAFRKFSESNKFSDFMNYFDMFAVQRDQVQRKKILDNKLDVVVAGIMHTNRCYYESALQGEYVFEVTPLSGDVTLHDKDPIFSPDLFQFNLVADRLVHLYKHGQFTKQTPSYVGLWKNNLLGYFEIHLNDDGIGKMYDFLGTASIQGSFTADKIRFLKQYHPGANTSLKDEIFFEGVAQGKGFGGSYMVGGYSGQFSLGSALDHSLFSDDQFRQVFDFWNAALSRWDYDEDRKFDLTYDDKFPSSEDDYFGDYVNGDDLPF